MFLYNYEVELQAKRALMSLREELAMNINRTSSFEAASTASEMLCIIARRPDHFLGLELINVLDNPKKYETIDISSMISAFLTNIQAHIEHVREMDPLNNINPVQN